MDSLIAVLPLRKLWTTGKTAVQKITECSSSGTTDSVFEIHMINFDSSQVTEFENLLAMWMTN